MDYRLLDPSKLLWLRTARGLKVTYPGTKSLTIQTPRVCATLVEPIPGLRNLEISFSDQCPSFSMFLKTCDDAATERMTEWWPTHRRIDTLRGWSDTWSLKDFGECLYFDGDGNVMHTEPLGKYECSAVVKLTGTWTKGGTSEIWGMKWDLVQIKVYGPSVAQNEEEDSNDDQDIFVAHSSDVSLGFGFVEDTIDDAVVVNKNKRQRTVENRMSVEAAYGFIDDDVMN
jgi:hypothetical protein